MMIPVQVQGFVKIFDPVSGEIFVDKKNANVSHDSIASFDRSFQKKLITN